MTDNTACPATNTEAIPNAIHQIVHNGDVMTEQPGGKLTAGGTAALRASKSLV
ncbi:MAG: hypothetical protein MJE68_04775 [Proteobacteria bacterium]|nr:hypothetical protein [Pseudomonadota bacterium]